ncbi:exosortase-associated EpsI family protein [Chloroflexota bacterium]
MGRLWESVFFSGFFILTFLFIVLLSYPAHGSRNASINIINVETWLKPQDTGKVDISKLKINLNEQGHLDNIPYQIGDWQGIDDKNAESLKKTLNADTLLMRTYRKDGSSQPIFLLIVNSESTGSIHPPKTCYSVQGYLIEESSEDTILIGDWALRNRINKQDLVTNSEPSTETMLELIATQLDIPINAIEIPVNKLLVKKTNKNDTIDRRLVYYHYFKDLEFIVRPEFSMLRVSAPIPEYNYGDIASELKDFMAEVFTLVFSEYSEERERVISIIAGFGLKGYLVILALLAVPLAMIIYPLATRKIFHSNPQEQHVEQETEITGNTINQSEGLQNKNDETITFVQPLNLPFDLAERTGNDKILGAYYNSQWVIEKITNISSASCPTLRDFLNRVSPELPVEVGEYFAQLTRIAESVLYNKSEKQENGIEESGKLAENIISKLSNRLPDG